MSENGSVGGAGSSAGGGSSGVGQGDNDSTSDSSNSSNDTQTTSESLASSPTTADTLSDGEAAQPDSASSSASNDTSPEPGSGSLDAAVAHSQTSAAQAAESRVQQNAVTPDTPAPVFDNDAANPNSNSNPNLGVTTSESLTSAASIGGTLVEGGINATKDHVDRSGRALAAATLTNGNAGRLPAAGYANRADLAASLTDARTNVTAALDASPYGPNALSSQQLASAARNANALGKAAGLAGTVVGPMAAAYEGYHSAPAESTTGERIANMIGGGIKEVDDSGVAALAGGLAKAGTVVAGGLISTGGVTAPAGVAVIASAPATGTAAAIGATKAYDGTAVDTAFDNFIDNTVEPALATAIDTSIDTYESAKSWASSVFDKVKSWF